MKGLSAIESQSGRLALRCRATLNERRLFCQGNVAAHAEKQVGASDYHHFFGREAAR